MVVHFICRGNTFRSIMAEAYLKSLDLPGVEVISSGTVAERDWASNKPKFQHTLAQLEKYDIKQYAKATHGDQLPAGDNARGDVVVCFSKRAHNELKRLITCVDNVCVWDIADIGEHGRVPKDEAGEVMLREDVFREIMQHVDALVAELKLAAAKH